MLRPVAILLILALFAGEILGKFDIIKKLIDEDTKVVRVRTVAERDRRWREHAVLDFIGLVEQYKGYTAEEHDVQTSDGYILKLHRITGSPSSPRTSGKPVVFIQHGLVSSSDFMVMMGPKQALAFQLADAGYDVWIGNVRGNTYTKRHVKYSTVKLDNEKFWNFSMDEIGKIDMPAFIDTILAKTGKTKLTFIGYSMGVTVSYILLSSKPEYNDKMNLVISIAPPIYFTQPYSKMLILMKNLIIPALLATSRLSGVYQVLPQSKLLQIVGKGVCVRPIGKPFCEGLLTSVSYHSNHTLLPLVLSHMPAGGSINSIDHYKQMIVTGRFQPYGRNYNTSVRALNLKESGRDYNVSQITSRQVIVYSKGDDLISVKGVKRLSKELKNFAGGIKVPDTFNHLDFMWAFEAREMVFTRILRVMEHYLRDN